MNKLFLFIALLFLSFTSNAQVISYDSIFQIRENEPQKLIGEIWEYQDRESTYLLYFGGGDTLYTTNMKDKTLKNDDWSWSMPYDILEFSFNDYSEYIGIFLNDSTIAGVGKNEYFQWQYRLKKK